MWPLPARSVRIVFVLISFVIGIVMILFVIVIVIVIIVDMTKVFRRHVAFQIKYPGLNIIWDRY